MFVRNGSTVLLITRAALFLVSLMCADAVIANPPSQSAAMYSASGRVIDAVTAQAIAGAHFVYGQPANDTNNGGFVTFDIGQTNSSGEFSLQHLKPGHYALYLSSGLDRSSDLYSDVLTFDICDADVTNLEVQARHGSKLSGFVVPAGVTSATTFTGLSSVKVVAAV